MKHQLLILLLFCSTSLLSQQNQNRQFHHWKNLLLVTKSYGINSEAVKIHTYSNKNRKKPANEWIFPWALGFEQSEIKKEVFLESGYKSYSSMYLSIGRNGFKHFKNNIYLNGMVSVGLGNEKLVEYSNEKKINFWLVLNHPKGYYLYQDQSLGWFWV